MFSFFFCFVFLVFFSGFYFSHSDSIFFATERMYIPCRFVIQRRMGVKRDPFSYVYT
jgi:hypothetical protein